MDDFKSEEQLKELIAKLDENGNKGLIYENILLLREAVKTYPTNYQLQFRLVNQLSFCQYRDGRGLDEDEINALNREAVEVGNRILSRCTDGDCVPFLRMGIAFLSPSCGLFLLS